MERVLGTPEGTEAWLAPLEVPAGDVAAHAALLSEDERARAGRFYFEADRRRFIVARAGLRRLLGRVLGVDPRTVAFSYGPRGKPALAGGGVHFNLSHSGGRALYVVSAHDLVGVDIECLDRDVDWRRLARRVLANRETEAVQGLPEAHRKRAFLALWTRKEAIVKATGDGMSVPVRQIELSADPDSAPWIISASVLPAGEWLLHAVDVGRDCVATVAAFRPR